jgi:hypothetical protein
VLGVEAAEMNIDVAYETVPSDEGLSPANMRIQHLSLALTARHWVIVHRTFIYTIPLRP